MLSRNTRIHQAVFCIEVACLALAAAKPSGTLAWLACALLGSTAFFALFRSGRDLATLLLPPIRLDFATEAVCRIAGRGRLREDSPQSPRSGEPILWYRLKRETRDRDDNWQALDDTHSSQPILLETQGRTCLLHSATALVRTRQVEHWETGDQRHTLWTLRADSPLQAIGQLRRAPEAIMQAPDDARPFVITDLPIWRLALPWFAWILMQLGLLPALAIAASHLASTGRLALG